MGSHFRLEMRTAARALLPLARSLRPPRLYPNTTAVIAVRRSPLFALSPLHTSAVLCGPSGLASAEQIRAIKSQAVIVDLRSPKEVADTPGPANALFWDFNADNTVPTAFKSFAFGDKATPVVFY